jgi:hypothetical protein
VVFASGADAERAVTARGLAFRRAGPPFAEWYDALRRRTRGVPGDGLAPARVERYFLPRLFGEIGTALVVDELRVVCRDVHPDMLVFDSLLFAGPLVAAVLGIRAVHHTVGLLQDDEVSELVADAVSPMWREFGLSVPPAAGVYEGTTLTVCPPTLDPAAARLERVTPLRPVPLPATVKAEPPVALPAGDEPLVYFTLGTFSNNPELFRTVLDALASEPVRLLVTTGRDVDPATLGPVPANARLERFLPQADVLPWCDAAVHHAGAGTAFGVLAHALPAVVLPQSADNFAIAARLQAAGVAVTLMPHELHAASLRAAVRTVLEDPSYRAGAARLAAEVAAMPSPAGVAATLRES